MQPKCMLLLLQRAQRAPSTPVNAERVSQIIGTPALEEQKGHHSIEL